MFVCSRSGNFVILIIYSHVIFDQYVRAEYCDLQSCGSKPHTMCKYPDSGPSSNCNQYVPAPLTAKEKTALVDRHNKLRMKVADGSEKRGSPGPQPKALDMTMLTWDDELAKVAQRWADQCSNGHDKCRNVERFSVGQNIATAWSTGKINKKIEDFVNDWYDEVRFFSRYYVDSYQFALSWGHYTQVVWAKTLTVGCAQVRFWDTARRMNTLRLICNYGPGGNYLNEPVYTASAPRPSLDPLLIFTIVLSCFKIPNYLPV